MARGYPDFFGYSVFPWYGAIAQTLVLPTVNIGATDDVITIAGKRVIYQGWIYLNGTVTHLTDSCALVIDGIAISTLTWSSWERRLPGVLIPTEPVVMEINEELFVYAGYFAGTFSVGQSCILRYTNNSAENQLVHAAFTYAMIQ